MHFCRSEMLLVFGCLDALYWSKDSVMEQSIAYNDCYAASLALIRSIKVSFDFCID